MDAAEPTISPVRQTGTGCSVSFVREAPAVPSQQWNRTVYTVFDSAPDGRSVPTLERRARTRDAALSTPTAQRRVVDNVFDFNSQRDPRPEISRAVTELSQFLRL